MRNWDKIKIVYFTGLILIFCSCSKVKTHVPAFTLIKAAETINYQGFVDCNIAGVWIKDTFRVFSGKYGKDPVWGDADQLRFASGINPELVFKTKPEDFEKPLLPQSVAPGDNGLHGAVWIESIYKSPEDPSEKTLFGLYHNEIYPSNYPYNHSSGNGYLYDKWPVGLRGESGEAAVCRIGIMKSADGGRSWIDKGIVLEDKQARMILKPHNTSVAFAGGVGDPSAVKSGDYLYIFYGEYGYPGRYDSATYDPKIEWEGQCISVARLHLADLDNPAKKAQRWDGTGFSIPYDGVGKPIKALQISPEHGGGATSTAFGRYYWGPSVSWNTYLQSWVMLMSRTEAPKWGGSAIFVSFNKHKDLGEGLNSQDWSKPELLVHKPLGDILWYPSLQPANSPEDIQVRNTSSQIGKKARLYYKYFPGGNNESYLSEYEIEFLKR